MQEQQVVFLVPWLEDETVFSLASRLHKLWGYPLAGSTTQILFGHHRGGSQHDFPTRLTEFAQNTKGLLGSATDIAKTHTLYKYYRIFLDEPECQDFVDALCGHSLAHFKLKLGLLTSRFRANHPLKACPLCMQADVERHGVAYWHLTHQCPGVWICPLHHIPLRESRLKSSGAERFLWHLPDSRQFRAWSSATQRAFIKCEDRLAHLGALIIDLVNAQVRGHLQIEQLQRCYDAALADKNYLTPAGKRRQRLIAEDFLTYVEGLHKIPEFATLPITVEEAQTQVSRLLRPMRSGTHPIRHFLLIDWLYGDAGAFLQRYGQMQQVSVFPSGRQQAYSQTLPETPATEIHRLVDVEHYSMRRLASHLQVDITTAMVWAARCGIVVHRRAKVLKPELHARLVKALQRGMDKAEAAQRYGLAVVTITKILRTTPMLHAQWQAARFEKAQRKARKDWEKAIQRYAKLGTKYLRSIEPTTYAWLYRNDRIWLQAHAIPALSSAKSSKPHVRWDERDRCLSHQVKDAVLKIKTEHPHKKLRLWQIYQEVPELKAKLNALDRLPLTRKCLDVALKHQGETRDLFD
ncbi:TnsD family Tn7-like transposition protein [Uliginosibacterium gangwonense]|uniref:TnsD family Tn7-like transposition protein n=1 Tax=Uliginosibacterium gangwonense TaxID=392736 RepID=UPI00037B15A9|nr:TnsD family Tn7-like transposition protein [Uliginosibacterium gangwonense]